MPRALYVTGRTFNLVRSRLPLMKKLNNKGWEVHAAALRQDELVGELESENIRFHHIPFARSSFSLKQDLLSVFLLLKLIYKLKPDLIHYFNPKPIVLGGVASRLLLRKPIQFVTLTGMGMVKEDTSRNRVILKAYKNAFAQVNGIVYENSFDRNFCETKRLAKVGKGRVMISSGVNMALFSQADYIHNQPVKILLASRLVWSKGIQELLDASEKLATECPGQAIVSIVGEIESGHPNSVAEEILLKHHQQGVINYLGAFKSEQMSEIILDHDIIVLPSYSEGFSKFLMEGAAAGKPLIASNISGCKEIVEHEKTGLLVNVKDSDSLLKAMIILVKSQVLREKYGANARLKALNEFDQDQLANQMLDYYRSIGCRL